MALSRRQFLLRSAAASGAAAASTLPVAGCAPSVGPAPSIEVAAPVDGVLTVLFSAAPQLQADGSAVILRAPGVAPILLSRIAEAGGAFAAMDATCTHLGCPLGVDDEGVVCPCHASRFGLDGAVLSPPAAAPLATYPADFAPGGQGVVVSLAAGDPGFPVVVGGQATFLFADFPELATVGGSVVGKPAGALQPIVVMALPGVAYAATEALCTHLGCRVRFNGNPLALQIECPCHGSRFSTDGSVLIGPATRPLRALSAAADADGVTVTFPA
jgi:cytochrome b6-f complex iron-sulfur subunit